MTGARRGPRAPIVLVGLSGAGKSSVGSRLARLLRCTFVDLDREIERAAGRSIPELFAERGEAGFRVAEAEATRALAARTAGAAASSRPTDHGERTVTGPVVAAGGGWMTNASARAALPDGRTVWLKVGPAEAARRLASSGNGRPLLAGLDPEGRLAELLAERLPAYREAAYTVETEGRTPEEVAREIADRLGPAAPPDRRSSETLDE